MRSNNITGRQDFKDNLNEHVYFNNSFVIFD